MSRRQYLADAITTRPVGWMEARRHDLAGVERFVLFAGHPRSGHTLIGSLLTAHPDAAIAHEAQALRLVRGRFQRQALFGALLRRDQQFAAAGSEWSSYSYAVPGQWQGRYRDLRVIGDKKGGGTSLMLHRHPELLARLERTVQVPVQFIVVLRHPLDNIARMSTRSGAPLAAVVDTYFRMAESLAWLGEVADCHWIPHEDFVAEPVGHLSTACQVLGLSADPAYLDAAVAIVNDSPRRAREAVEWADGQQESIMERALRYPFLTTYLAGDRP